MMFYPTYHHSDNIGPTYPSHPADHGPLSNSANLLIKKKASYHSDHHRPELDQVFSVTMHPPRYLLKITY